MRRLAKAIAAVVLLAAALLAGLYVARNPERADLTDAARAAAGGQYVRLRDGVTHYELREPTAPAASPAPLVVLVHGFSVPLYVWDSTAAALADAGHAVLRYDLYGRGWSDRPPLRYDAGTYVRQLAELLDSLRVREPVHLAGLSMGGWVAASFVAAHPERVRTLTLVGPVAERAAMPAPIGTPGIGPLLFQAVAVPGMAEGQMTDFARPERFPEWPARYEPQTRYRGFGRALWSSARALSVTDLDSVYARAGRTGRPVLLIWGREDRTVPFALHAVVQRAIPAAELVAVDSAGHLPHMENGPLVHAALLRFLAAHGPGAASAWAAADTAVALARPAVIALYAVPPDSVLTADEGLQSLLDDFMYYWADARPRLERLGVAALDQPLDWRARALRLRLDGRERRFALEPDSAGHRGAVGYLLAAPGREPRLLHGVIVDEALEDSARAYFGRGGAR